MQDLDVLNLTNKSLKTLTLKLSKAQSKALIDDSPSNSDIVQEVDRLKLLIPGTKPHSDLSSKINSLNYRRDCTVTLLTNQQPGSSDILNIRIAGEKGAKNDIFKTILQQRTNTTTWTDSDTGKAIQCPLCETDPSIKQFTKLTFAHAAACKHVTGLNHIRHDTIVNATAEELSRSGYSVAAWT
eukprot:TRINITY_DN12631_c1_g2_i13.p1 TRINITY_DN12631_c1_g2~~TRINITY_DN12631_c1_g2_i13.p1  ORF type:complete len:184 (+),score=30.46 TRINITY_DN12631_c1_g2_i13:1209-1760(+)